MSSREILDVLVLDDMLGRKTDDVHLVASDTAPTRFTGNNWLALAKTPMARPHWREYLIEVAAFAAFMVSAATMTVALEHPASPLRSALPLAMTRRGLMGMAMGLTAATIIYSPWGRRSGAHMNPAVTLTYFHLGKIAGRDAVAYIGAQFLGGVIGIGCASLALAGWISDPAVNYVITSPGVFGNGAAFAAEALISFVLMLVVLSASNQRRMAPYTGAMVAVLVAVFITFEAPLSGMSMNPARSLAPDVIGDVWRGLWIYFTAPPLGMLIAAETFVRFRGPRSVLCAKLHHDKGPCIFNCGYLS
jgi:aquaporin Z